MIEQTQPYSKEHMDSMNKIIDILAGRTDEEHHVIISGVILSAFGNIRSKGQEERASDYLNTFINTLIHVYKNQDLVKKLKTVGKNDRRNYDR